MEERMRKTYLDVLKGIGIFFVVFGHVTRIAELREFIWNFHMPLFFLISGFLFNPGKYQNFSIFFKSRIKSIYIPYVLFFLVTFLYWVTIERNVRGGEYSILHQFLGLFYGTYEGNHLYFNGALWFLPCLFSVELMFYYVSKVKHIGIIALLILSYVLGSLILQFKLNVLPLGIHTAFFAIIFYGIGFISKRQETKFINLSLPFKILILTGSFLVQVLAVQYGYHSKIADSPLFYIPLAIVGILFYFVLSIQINKNRILEYLGKNSLIILAFQEQIYRAVISIFNKLLNLNINIIRANLLYCIAITIISLLIIVPIIYLYNNYVRERINKLL